MNLGSVGLGRGRRPVKVFFVSGQRTTSRNTAGDPSLPWSGKILLLHHHPYDDEPTRVPTRNGRNDWDGWLGRCPTKRNHQVFLTDGLGTFGEYAFEKNATRKTKDMEGHSFFPVHNTTQKILYRFICTSFPRARRKNPKLFALLTRPTAARGQRRIKSFIFSLPRERQNVGQLR